VLAVTVTVPVGPTPVPVTEKFIVTACPPMDGSGVSDEIVVALPILVALVTCDLEAAEYCEVAGQVAATVQDPVPLVIVTSALELVGVPLTAPTVQMPEVPVICGSIPALVVAVTVKLELYWALEGAPVNVTVGVCRLTVRLPWP